MRSNHVAHVLNQVSLLNIKIVLLAAFIAVKYSQLLEIPVDGLQQLGRY
jgi:hypothetical protein